MGRKRRRERCGIARAAEHLHERHVYFFKGKFYCRHCDLLLRSWRKSYEHWEHHRGDCKKWDASEARDA